MSYEGPWANEITVAFIYDVNCLLDSVDWLGTLLE